MAGYDLQIDRTETNVGDQRWIGTAHWTTETFTLDVAAFDTTANQGYIKSGTPIKATGVDNLYGPATDADPIVAFLLKDVRTIRSTGGPVSTKVVDAGIVHGSVFLDRIPLEPTLGLTAAPLEANLPKGVRAVNHV